MAGISIRGVSELTRKLGQAATMETLRPPMQRSVMRLQRGMAKYPLPPAGSTYIRTGTLGRRWTTRITQTSTRMVGKVGNNTSYGPFVQSKQFQAWMHKGRWQTDEDIVEQNRNAIMGDFEKAIQDAIR